jgi:hypothetical protein
MVPRTCVIQYDDRSDEALGDQARLISINKRMCVSDGASYTLHRNSPHNLPPYWQKVQLTSDALRTGACDEVLYLDTDAVLRHPPSKVVAELDDKSFLMSGDMPPWEADFNAGVWAVRNDDAGNRIIQDWLNKYDPTSWSVEDKVWKCQTKNCDALGCKTQECEWAGPEYEQGSMSSVIQSNEGHFKKIGWDQLQHHCSSEIGDNTLACHFAGIHKKAIGPYLQSYEFDSSP